MPWHSGCVIDRTIRIARPREEKSHVMKTMKAVVFKGKDRIAVEEVPKPMRLGRAKR